MSKENCSKHNLPILQVCIAPSCGNFRLLCKNCIPDHNSFVQSNNTFDPHPKLREYIEIKKNLSETLNDSKKKLENLLEMGSKIIQVKNEKNLDSVFMEIDRIQEKINEIFQNFKSTIKRNFDYKLKEVDREIMKLYEDVGKALDFCLKYCNKNLPMDVVKDLYLIDLDYQVFYKEEKMKKLCLKKNETNLEADIRKEYKDKFFVTFHTGLYDLVDFGLNNSLRKSTMLSNSLNKDEPSFEIIPNFNQNYNSFCSNWIYYFEEGKKNLFYIDIFKSKSKIYEKVALNIPNPIYYNHRSIVTSSGDIYLLGGYLDNINEANEDSFNYLYRYDNLNRTLIPLAKMKTLRHSFGMCSIKNKIYVVGGANYKEGAMIKCEYYDIETNKWTPFNFLNIKSMCHSVVAFSDSHIYKFGGLRYNYNDKIEGSKMSIDLFERYDVNFDFWERIKLKDNAVNSPLNTWFTGCCAINGSNILVFGGKNEKNEPQKQTFLINIPKDDIKSSEREEMNFAIIELNSKLLNHAAFFNNSSAIIKDKNLVILGNTSDNEKKIFVFDSKSWRNL